MKLKLFFRPDAEQVKTFMEDAKGHVTVEEVTEGTLYTVSLDNTKDYFIAVAMITNGSLGIEN